MSTTFKYLFILLALLSVLHSCKPKSKPAAKSAIETPSSTADSAGITGFKFEDVDEWLITVNEPWRTADTTGIMHMSLQQLMQRVLPEVCRYAASDTTFAFYNNVLQARFPSMSNLSMGCDYDTSKVVEHLYFNDDECGELLAIGKFIDDKQAFAIAYTEKTKMVYFYRLHNKQWKEVGRRKTELPTIFDVYFEELNAKPGLEIVLATGSNMNGNSWMECFSYFPKEDKIKFAGDFSTHYTVNLKDTIMTEEYEGSHYMSPSKTVYGWYNNELVTLRQMIIVSPDDSGDTIPYIEYYENPTRKKLKRIFREPYNSQNPTHDEEWNHFFELDKAISYSEFETFFPRFRSAVLRRDMAALAGMINEHLTGDCLWSILFGGHEDGVKQERAFNYKIPQKVFLERIDSLFTPIYRSLLSQYDVKKDLHSSGYRCEKKVGKKIFSVDTEMNIISYTDDGKAKYREAAFCMNWQEPDADICDSFSICLYFVKTPAGIKLLHINCMG